LVLLYLSVASLDARDALAAEAALRVALEADSNDLQTRYGLARCLIILGRHDECEQILDVVQDAAAADTLQALSHVLGGRTQDAAETLPSSPPPIFVADYWYVQGLIAFNEARWPDAETSFRRAVDLRPLSKNYWSQYCEALRRTGRLSVEQSQVEHLETVLGIVKIARSESTTLDRQTAEALAASCEAVGAATAAQIVSEFVSNGASRETPPPAVTTPIPVLPCGND